jgi:hypothetical protein
MHEPQNQPMSGLEGIEMALESSTFCRAACHLSREHYLARLTRGRDAESDRFGRAEENRKHV